MFEVPAGREESSRNGVDLSESEVVAAPSEPICFPPDSSTLLKSFSVEKDVAFNQSLLFEAFERGAALILIILSLPVMLTIALRIRCDKNGSVLFKQTRVGLNDSTFEIYKFRTMRPDAEVDGPFICDSYDDPRITKLGKFLRKTKLDEFPQLLNILRGEMSFVGPRPERPVFHDKFSKTVANWGKRTSVKPGITGIAQVSRTISHNPHEKIKADLEYIENRSLSLYLKLILQTVRLFFRSF